MRTLNRLDLLLLSTLAILAIIARILPDPRTIDDAFITFRYARNLADGVGFVYNSGIRTLGTTTPLYTILLAGVGSVLGTGDYPYYALIVNALADAGTCILIVLIIRQITGNRWIGWVGGLLWAINPVSVTFAIGGMETSVVILLQVGTVYCVLNRQWRTAGATAALGLLTRIDSVWWVAPLLVLTPLLQTPRPIQREILSAWLKAGLSVLVIYGTWSLFSLIYFGTALPNSISAKTVAYVIAPGSALIRLIQSYSTPFAEFDAFGSSGALAACLAYSGLSIVAVLYVWRRDRRLIAWLLYPWIYMIVFSVANPLIFRWYVAPPLPALMVGILLGAYALLSRLTNRRPRFNLLYAALGTLWLYSSIQGWTLAPDHGPNRPAPKMAWHKLELIYAQLGERLRVEYDVTPATLVGSADIGAIGYYSRAVILDTVGLVTPELRCYYPFDPGLLAEPGQNYAIPPALIMDALPPFLVTPESFVRAGLELQASFKAAYADPILRVPTDFYGTDVRVYALKITEAQAAVVRRTPCGS